MGDRRPGLRKPPLTVAEIGEFGLIALLKSRFERDQTSLILGIDDDCALIEGREGHFFALTCDSQVENVHFLSQIIPPRLLGRRVLGVNLSDLAAVGAVPQYALLSLILRKDCDLAWLEEVMEGLQSEAENSGVVVVGGNTARTDGNLVFDVTLMGEVSQTPLLLRKNARVGDRIMVTGTLGDSAAGLALCQDSGQRDKYPDLATRYFCPTPRITVGQILSEFDLPFGLIDISDGFAQDLGHILKQSGVGAVIEVDDIPLSSQLTSWSRETGRDPYQLALWGGEDYELIVTVPEESAETVKKRVEHHTGVPLTSIGRIAAETELVLRKNGERYQTVQAGWNHF